MTKPTQTQALKGQGALNPSDVLELSYLLGPPPLLPSENVADYEALSARVIAAAKPTDAIEHLYVRDAVDLQWELMRLRHLKTRLLVSSASVGLFKLMDDRMNNVSSDPNYKSWIKNEPQGIKNIKSMLADWGLGESDIYAQTLAKKIDEFERIDRLAANAEARRNAALRELERHREAVGRRLRNALSTEDAQFVDADAAVTSDTQVLGSQST
ncbi:MAG: hypothetical protein EB015_12740 [Methylocystaceae bacterium]|nr:hypothetical protein [Methylocystaceae bacterium]